MKCPMCNKGNMKKVIDRISKDNIEFETFRCDYCKEELMDGRQLKMLANKEDVPYQSLMKILLAQGIKNKHEHRKNR